MANKPRILVVGAGLTGATIARELADRGEHPVVVERSGKVGGFVRDHYDDRQQCFHHEWGPHIFHTSDVETWAWFDRFASLKPLTFTSLVSSPHLSNLPMPISFHTLKRYFPKGAPEAILEYLKSKRNLDRVPVEDLPEDCFERVLRSKVGDWLYEDCFKHYSENFWGMPGSHIPGSIARRIPIRRNWDVRYHSDFLVGVPLHGYTETVERMLQGIPVIFGANLELNSLRGWDRIYWTGSLSDEIFPRETGSWVFAYRRIRVVRPDSGATRSSGFQQLMWNFPNLPDAKDAEPDWIPVREYVSANLTPRSEFAEDAQISRIDVFKEDVSDTSLSGLAYPLPVEEIEVQKREAEIRKTIRTERFFLAGRLGRHQYLDMNRAIEQARKLVANTL